MQNHDQIFESIRPWWLEEAKIPLSDIAGIIPGSEMYAMRIFEGIKSGLAYPKDTVIFQIINEWSKVEGESQINLKQIKLVDIWTNMMTMTFEVARQRLKTEDFQIVSSDLMQIFVNAIRCASDLDIRKTMWNTENELLRVRQTLERNEGSKADFISVAAHELRTPLTLIEGYASMMRDAMPTEDSKRLQAALCMKGINAGTRRLREIIDDMIDVSMIDNNLLALNFQPLWINKILDSIGREFLETINERNLKFQVTHFPGGSEMIYGDGERLYQAFRNITANAIKYTPDGGSIIIEGRSLPGFVEVVVADTGIGIAPEQHTKIFEKFGRLGRVAVHSSGKTKFKGGGPGLGLPITKGIIEAHGGAIWVESDGYDEVKCPGAKFHIMLPVRKSPPGDRALQFFNNKD